MEKINNNFSFRRVGMIINDIIVANRKKFTMQIAVMVAIILASILFFTHMLLTDVTYDGSVCKTDDGFYYDPTQSMTETMFYVYAILFMALSASSFNKWMSTKAKRLATLMTPATRTEKFAACFAVYILLFMVVLGATLEICDLIRVGYAHAAFPELKGVMPLLPEMRDTGTPSDSPMLGWFILLVGTNASIFMLGSMIWPRNSFLYSCVAILALGIFVVISLNLIKSLFLEPGYYYPNMEVLRDTPMTCIAAWTVIIFCTVTSYLRFHDDEITKRW